MEKQSSKPVSAMDAAPRCQHIKDNGYLCNSPALAGQPFCYNHDRIHCPPAHPRKNPTAFIPYLETGQALQIAVTNICRAVCSGDLDPKQANAIFNGMRVLKIAFEHLFAFGDGPQVVGYTRAMADAMAMAYAPPREEDEEFDQATEFAEEENAKSLLEANGNIAITACAVSGGLINHRRTNPVMLNEDAGPSEAPRHSSSKGDRTLSSNQRRGHRRPHPRPPDSRTTSAKSFVSPDQRSTGKSLLFCTTLRPTSQRARANAS